VKPVDDSFYAQVQQLRETFPPQDDSGLAVPETAARQSAWQRANGFAGPV
jgi:hypothetical protein